MTATTITQLHPVPPQVGRALTLDDLVDLHAPRDRANPRVRANFVASVDGSATAAGRTRVLIVGAGPAGLAAADAAAVVAVAEIGKLDRANRNADQVLSFLADQLSFGEKLPQVVTDATFDDLAEALMVLIDFHATSRVHAGRRQMLHMPTSTATALPARPM